MRISTWLLIPAASLCSTSLAAPVTVPDGVVLAQCSETSVYVLANDLDPAGALPLMLVSVSEVSLGTASIVGPDTIRFVSGEKSGSEVLTYFVRNAAGDMSPGQLAITVTQESRCS